MAKSENRGNDRINEVNRMYQLIILSDFFNEKKVETLYNFSLEECFDDLENWKSIVGAQITYVKLFRLTYIRPSKNGEFKAEIVFLSNTMIQKHNTNNWEQLLYLVKESLNLHDRFLFKIETVTEPLNDEQFKLWNEISKGKYSDYVLRRWFNS